MIEVGRLAAGTCGGGAGEVEGDEDGELLLKGFFRMEDPLSALVVMVESTHRESKDVNMLSGFCRSWFGC